MPERQPHPQRDDIASVVAATVCLVNDERIRFGEPALIEDPHLASAAAGHSRDMDEHDYFAHTSPTGQTLLMRIEASGFIPNSNVGYTLGENIAWGTLWLRTPRAIVKAWMAVPRPPRQHPRRSLPLHGRRRRPGPAAVDVRRAEPAGCTRRTSARSPVNAGAERDLHLAD